MEEIFESTGQSIVQKGEIRLSKLIKRYKVGLDTLADYLRTKDVIVERTPNYKISTSHLKDLDQHCGYLPEAKQDSNSNITGQFPEEVQRWIVDLQEVHNELFRLAGSGGFGKKVTGANERNQRIVNLLAAHVKKEPTVRDAVRGILQELSDELFTQIKNNRSRGVNPHGTDLLIRIRNRYLMAIDSMVPDDISVILEVGWDKVRFEDGRLLLDIGKERPLICSHLQSRMAYNMFRSAFICRVPPLKVRIYSKKSPEVIETPEFKEIFEYLDIMDDIRLGSFNRRKELVSFIRKSRINFQDAFLPKDRSPYIQYLVNKQARAYRYIPVFEKQDDREDAFLFTLKGAEIYIVWENINENTATYVFNIRGKNYDEVLQAIFDYASSDIEYKRMRMHYGDSRKLFGVECRVLNHNDLNQWKRVIDSL